MSEDNESESLPLHIKRPEQVTLQEYIVPQSNVFSEVVPRPQTDQDVVEKAVVHGRWPVTIVCDGVSEFPASKKFAEQLSQKAMSEVTKLLMNVKSHAEIRAKLQDIFTQLNDEAKEVQGSAASTLVVSFLFFPEDHSESPQWWIAGVGNGVALLLREDGELVDRSPHQVVDTPQGNFTHAFPYQEVIPPFIDTVAYRPGDIFLTATDGLERVMKQVRKNSKGSVLRKVLQTVSAADGAAFQQENLQKLFEEHKDPSDERAIYVGPYIDDVGVAVMVTS